MIIEMEYNYIAVDMELLETLFTLCGIHGRDSPYQLQTRQDILSILESLFY